MELNLTINITDESMKDIEDKIVKEASKQLVDEVFNNRREHYVSAISSHYDMYKKALEQFKTSKEFSTLDSNPRMTQFYEIAIYAIRKQIPAKVLNPINKDGQHNKLVTYCYCCGEIVEDVNYCSNCGQKTDWNIGGIHG